MTEKYFINSTKLSGFEVWNERLSWTWYIHPGCKTLTEAIKHAQRRGYDTIVTVVME